MAYLRLMVASGALWAALGASPASANSVFRWVDRNGMVHYDDTSTGHERMTLDYLAKRQVPGASDWTGEVPAELILEAKDQCANAKDRLANTQSASRIYGRDPSGNTYLLSATQVHLMIHETEQDMNYWCRPDAARKIYVEMLAERRAQLKAAAEVPKSRPIPVEKMTSIR